MQASSQPTYAGHSPSRLWSLLKPDRAELLIVVGFAIGLGVLTLATPVAVQSLVNFIAFGGLMQPLIVVGLLLLFFLAFAGAIRVFKAYIVEVLQRRVFIRVVGDLSERLPKVRADAYDRGHGPEMVNRFFDVLTVQKSGSTLLVDGLDIVLQTSIGLLVLGFYHPLLLLFDVVLILCIAFILFGLGRGGVSSARRESSAKYKVADALEELARAPVTYKLIGAPELANARLSQLTNNYISERRRHYSVVFRQMVGAVSLHALAATSLLTLGGFLVIRGQLTLGQLVAAELIVSVALVSFVKFHKQLEAYYDLRAGVDKLGMLYDLPLETDRGGRHDGNLSGAALELRHVSYRYQSNTSSHGSGGVDNISFKVKPGQRLAICGRRGSGKTTIAELLSGLRDPDSGMVLLDGVDIREISKDCVRAQLDLVQGLEVVQGDILDNVRLGRKDIPDDMVRDTLSRLGILDELLEMPEGLRSPLATNGAPLSRSTVLLLMLARAVVASPRAIVIDRLLDELDPDSLEQALSVLTGPAADWTLVVFTTRPRVAEAMNQTLDLMSRLPSAQPPLQLSSANGVSKDEEE